MSRRLDVLLAVKAMIQIALPGIKLMGLEGEEAAPSIIPDCGRVVVRSGDPGDPEYTLSPLTYYWEHRIPIEVAAFKSGGLTTEECLDAMLVAIGAAVEADRTLGGLCDWIDLLAPETEDILVFNDAGQLVARPRRGAELILTASYTTSGPLS